MHDKEIVISSSIGEEGKILLWELSTGTVIGTIDPAKYSIDALTCVGSEHVVGASKNKSVLLIWNILQQKLLYKCSTPYPVTCICSSNSGHFLAVGTSSGLICVWEVATGLLLRSWEAHYGSVSCLNFVDDDSMLLSAGEDSNIFAWNLGRQLALKDDVSSSHGVFRSFSGHSLHITCLFCGFGGINARLFSSSQDRTCRIWDIPTSNLLGTLMFPVCISTVTTDLLERYLFAGGVDGRIFRVDLLPSYASSPASLAASEPQTFVSHSHSVSCISVSRDGSLLISGAADGVVIVWNIQSFQALRRFSVHKIGNMTSERKQVEALPRHFAPLKKYPTAPDSLPAAIIRSSILPSSQFVSDMDLNRRDEYEFDVFSSLGQSGSQWLSDAHTSSVMDQFLGQNTAATHKQELIELRSRVQALREENERWKVVNNQLYDMLLEKAEHKETIDPHRCSIDEEK